MSSSRRALVAALVLSAGVLTGCGFGPPGTPQPSASASRSAPSPSAVAGGDGRSAGGSAATSPASSGVATPDPSLFAVIGGDAKELTFQYDPDTTASVAADPGLARDAAALAIGLYTVAGQQPVADYGIASILRLRDPSADEEWFRSYRDSYDESACAQAGGVARHSQTVVNDHTVFIGACAGGAFTYHVRVKDGSIVVSITSVGPADLGVRLVADVERP